MGKTQAEVSSLAVSIGFLPLNCAGVTCDKPSHRLFSTLGLGAFSYSSHSHLDILRHFLLQAVIVSPEDACTKGRKVNTGAHWRRNHCVGAPSCLLGMVGVGLVVPLQLYVLFLQGILPFRTEHFRKSRVKAVTWHRRCCHHPIKISQSV